RRHLAAALLLLAAAAPAVAANNTWTNAAANVTWNTTSANWSSPTVWNNANVDSAIFGATGVGTITLQNPITARAVQFDTAGYTDAGHAPGKCHHQQHVRLAVQQGEWGQRDVRRELLGDREPRQKRLGARHPVRHPHVHRWDDRQRRATHVRRVGCGQRGRQ